LRGVPATAVVTANLARLTTDVGKHLLRGGHAEAAARKQINRIWPSFLRFVVGRGLGAVCEAGFGLQALAPPYELALLGLALAQTDASMSKGAGRAGADWLSSKLERK
jgi:uncharacterized membrane protein YoaK (UPF0700 family)